MHRKHHFDMHCGVDRPGSMGRLSTVRDQNYFSIRMGSLLCVVLVRRHGTSVAAGRDEGSPCMARSR